MAASTAPAPIKALHVGSGEPLLLLHPFMLSPHAWSGTAEQLASTFEVFAPALAGHWGGPAAHGWNVTAATLADEVERQLDDLGWQTCHIAGNSLGGWVALELERRGRARTLTLIAPAGGWTHLSAAEIQVGVLFSTLYPFTQAGRLLGRLATNNRFIQRCAVPLVVRDTSAVSPEAAEALLLAATHCAVIPKVIWSAFRLRVGVTELSQVQTPTQLVLCRYDRILPIPRLSRMFTDLLPLTAIRVTMERAGHVPMMENPADVAGLITSHIRGQSRRLRAV